MAQYLDYKFEGKTAIVTGAGSGIGKACAVELAKGGAKLALFGRRENLISDVAHECHDVYGAQVAAFSVDVSDREQVNSAVKIVSDTFGSVDILVNNAGIESRLKPGQTFEDLFEILDEETYMKFFEVHSLGHYFTNLAVIPAMREKKFGRIVNVTSVTGVTGEYSTPAYTASKAAAICQTKAFARKYAADNITVNSISPGMVDTPMKIDSPPEEFEYVASITPLGRVAQPVDIARVAMFLAQENLFITGQNIIADGGAHIL
jgi:3-oxoacyl-[acyl-carrier protein] reductase